jgi:hypothetical protein
MDGCCIYSTITISAMGAFFFTEAIPFFHEISDSYASLVAITSPLAALSLHLHLPALSVYISNLGANKITN